MPGGSQMNNNISDIFLLNILSSKYIRQRNVDENDPFLSLIPFSLVIVKSMQDPDDTYWEIPRHG